MTKKFESSYISLPSPHPKAELYMLYAIDCQHSETPWKWWEIRNIENGNHEWFEPSEESEIDFSDEWEYRRKDSAPKLRARQEACTWEPVNDSSGTTCKGRILTVDSSTYCPDCGKPIILREILTTVIAGTEIPIPITWEERKDTDYLAHVTAGRSITIQRVPNRKAAYDSGLVQRTADRADLVLEAVKKLIKTELENGVDPSTPDCYKNSLRAAMSSASKDWSLDKADAWLYGIICGWDAATLSELRARFHWTDETCTRLNNLHKKFMNSEQRYGHIP